MAGTIDARLKKLGIELPEAAAPVANYVPCAQAGNLVFVSGQVPVWNGEFRHKGRVPDQVSVEEAKTAARLCGLNIVAQLRAFLGDLDRVRRVVKLGGFVNAAPEAGDHPQIINACSDLMVEVFGDKGKHARFAVGAGSLPLTLSVEIDAVVEVD